MVPAARSGREWGNEAAGSDGNTHMTSARATSWALVLVFLFGLYLRVDTVIHTIVDNPLRGDAGQYFTYAFNLHKSGVYSREFTGATPMAPVPVADALRSPGYPLFLLPFAGGVPSDSTFVAIGLTQAVIGAVLILLTFLLGRRFMPAPVALIPPLLVAVSPQLIIMPTYVLTETLFCTLLAGALVCLLASREARVSWTGALGAGLLLGAAALTRPTVSYLWIPLGMLVAAYWPAASRTRALVGFLAGVAFVMFPWFARNYFAIGTFSDPTLSTLTLIHGHYPGMMFDNRPETLGYPYRFDPEIESMSANTQAAIAGIASRINNAPLEYVHWYLLDKPIAFFSWRDVSATADIFTYPVHTSPFYGVPFYLKTLAMMRVTHAFWVLCAWAALLIALLTACWRRAVPPFAWALTGTVLVYFLLLHMVAFPIARYSQPLFPILFVLATAGGRAALVSALDRKQGAL